MNQSTAGPAPKPDRESTKVYGFMLSSGQELEYDLYRKFDNEKHVTQVTAYTLFIMKT